MSLKIQEVQQQDIFQKFSCQKKNLISEFIIKSLRGKTCSLLVLPMKQHNFRKMRNSQNNRGYERQSTDFNGER